MPTSQYLLNYQFLDNDLILIRSCLFHFFNVLIRSKTLNVEPLFRIERSQLRWFVNVIRMSHERLA